MYAGLLTIEGLLGILEKTRPSSEFFRGAAEVLDSHLLSASPPRPRATPRGPRRLLTIGMATYNDYHGVYFSVQALRLYHPEITDLSEILVIDNDPLGPCAPSLKLLEDRVPGYRYFPYDSFRGTTVRDLLFREANSEYVLVMDAHVFFAPGSLAKLAGFLETQQEAMDLWQGPLLSDGLEPYATHFNPVWSAGMYGQWSWDARAADVDAPPFEIPMQGLGVFACRKDAWPGFNPRLQGFGGEEGYIHEKVRRNGGTTLCLPFLRWLHRFRRPGGAPYKPTWADRIRNYLIAYDELKLDPGPVVEHFGSLLGAETARPMIDAARREIAGPYHQYDGKFAIGADPARCETLIGSRVRRIDVPQTPSNPEIGRVLAHRSAIAEAVWQGLRNVLVLEGDPLGGVVYESENFDRFLRETPDTPTTVALWLRKQGTLEPFGRPMRIQ
jgi:Glycosyl transferase family 2